MPDERGWLNREEAIELARVRIPQSGLPDHLVEVAVQRCIAKINEQYDALLAETARNN